MFVLRRLVVLSFVLSMSAVSSLAVTNDFQIFLDHDQTPGSGCSVLTAEGSFGGIEQIVDVTVETVPGPSATVTGVTRRTCNEGTNTFGPPETIDDSGWPVGVGLGTDGTDVIELYVPNDFFPGVRTFRLGIAATTPSGTGDALLESAAGAITAPASPSAIPTLGEWALILTALLLTAAGLWVLRKQRGSAIAVLLALLLLGGAGVAWAAVMLDGNPSDWTGVTPLAEDPFDNATGPDIRAFFSQIDNYGVFFRIDASLVFNTPPVAQDDAFTTDEDTAVNGDVQADNGSGADADADLDTLTVTMINGSGFTPGSPFALPSGALLTMNANGTFNWDPNGQYEALSSGDSDAYSFTYTIDDGKGGSDSATVDITINGVNDAPTITSNGGGATASIDAAENQTAVTDAQATDPEGETEGSGLTWSITGGADAAKFSINATTGVLTFASAPDYETPGDANSDNDYQVQITVTDSASLTDVQDVTVTVTNVNDPPAITSDGGGATASVNAAENQTAVTDAEATDPEGDTEGSGLTWSITGGADAAKFSINATTGVLTFASAPDYEAPADTNIDNGYEVQITVTDSGSLTDVQDITVTVTDVNEAPVITSNGGGATASVNVAENQTAVTDAQATDPDGETEGAGLTWSITGGADAAKFSINATTGVLTFASAPDYETPGDANGDNDYEVQITVTDSGPLTDAQDITVTVTNVNEPPVAVDDDYSGAGNTAAGNTEFAAGGASGSAVAKVVSALSIASNDMDPDGDSLTYSVASSSTTNGGTVVMSSDGSFVYTPPSNPAITSDTFTYTVSDPGSLSATATVTIDIDDFVWYVDRSNTTAPFDGTSTDPFQTLTQAETASSANQTIYVFKGDSGSTPYAAGITLENGQKLFGEGVDLVVTLASTPVTLVTGNPANKPVVRTTTSCVIVDSTGGTMDNVEIRGLDLGNTATDDTVSITEAGNPVSVGLSLLDLNPNTTAGGTTALAIDGSGPSTITVFHLANITVSQAGAAVNGIVATDTTFDANPADSDFTGDTVSAGTITVGSSGARLGGTGVSLQNVSGDLSITDLDIFTSGASGLDVTGSGLLNAAAGTGFGLSAGGGSSIDATNATAIRIDPATVGMTLATVNSSGSSGSGILLDSLAGTITINGGNLSNAGGAAFAVVGGTVSATFSGSISQASNAPAVSVSGGHGTGTLTFDTGTIGATNGTGLQFDNADGTYLFNGTVTLNGGDAGIDIVNGSSGTMTLSATGSSITSPSGPAINVNGGAPAVTFAGSVTQTNAARLAAIQNLTGGSVVLSGNLNGSGSTGMLVQNNSGGTFTFSGGTKTVNTGTSAAVTLAGNTGAAINFSNGGLDIDTTSGAGFSATGGGTVTVTGSGKFGDHDGGHGGQCQCHDDRRERDDLRLGLDQWSRERHTADQRGWGLVHREWGIDRQREQPGRGRFGGTGNVTIGTTISTTAAGRSVEVTGHTGGAVSFSGAIDDNGLGINLDSNSGGTITFTGGLDIDSTTNTGFNATGGGTVQATQNNSTILNTVNTTTGTAVKIQNTTIGSSDVTFRSVSANGATNGIVLNNTGSSGTFEVTGSGTTDASGGTVRNTSSDAVTANNVRGGVTLRNMVLGDSTATLGQAKDATNNIGADGIDLVGVDDVVLTNMRIARTKDHGIDGTDVTNFSISDSEIFNAGDSDGDSGISFEGVGSNNLDGTATITSTTVDAPVEMGLRVQNSSGILALTISGSRFSGTANTASLMFGEDGVQIEVLGTAQTTASIGGGSIFSNLESDGIQGTTSESSGAILNLTIDGNTFTGFDNGAPNMRSDNAIELNATGGTNLGNGPRLRYTINGNTMNSSSNSAILVGANDFTQVDGRITGNTINGSKFGYGIEATLAADDNSVAHMLVSDNEISNHNQPGAFFNTNNSGALALTFNGNSITTQPLDATAFENLTFQTTNGLLCVAAESNVVVAGGANAFGAGSAADAVAMIRTGGTAQLEMGSANLFDPASAVLTTNNPDASGVFTTGTIGVFANGTCATPVTTPTP